MVKKTGSATCMKNFRENAKDVLKYLNMHQLQLFFLITSFYFVDKIDVDEAHRLWQTDKIDPHSLSYRKHSGWLFVSFGP